MVGGVGGGGEGWRVEKTMASGVKREKGEETFGHAW